MTDAPALRHEGIIAATAVLVRLLRESRHDPSAITKALVSEYLSVVRPLEAARARSISASRGMSETTKILMSLRPGQIAVVPNQAAQSIRGRMKTARVQMGVPDAVWRTWKAPDGRRMAKRLPNGSQAEVRLPEEHSAKSHELFGIKLGESIVSEHWSVPPGQKRTQIGNNHKVAARKLLGNPMADWRMSTMANGKVKIRRIK